VPSSPESIDDFFSNVDGDEIIFLSGIKNSVPNDWLNSLFDHFNHFIFGTKPLTDLFVENWFGP
jgi:hypothetical protein